MAFSRRVCRSPVGIDDTVYQQAQIKTYQTLGRLLGETLKTLRLANPAKPG